MNKQTQPTNWDGLTGVVSILFGLSYGGYAYLLPRPMFGNPWEPIFMPLAIAVFTVFIGILLVINGRIAPSVAAVKEFISAHPQRKTHRYRIALTCLVSLIYAAIFEHAGFILSTALFMFSMLVITCEIRKWKSSLLIAVLFSTGIYFIFNELLAINLPVSSLFN